MERLFGWDLPPGVRSKDSDDQCGDEEGGEVLVEGECDEHFNNVKLKPKKKQ